MSSGRSKREIALIIATGGSAVAFTCAFSWLILKYGQLQHVFALFLAPFLILALASAWALWMRKPIGAWGSLAFFALQIVTLERDGAPFWPGYSFGIGIEVFRSTVWEVNLSVSSLVFAFLAIGAIRQHWEARVLKELGNVEPLLPPNTSLERTRER